MDRGVVAKRVIAPRNVVAKRVMDSRSVVAERVMDSGDRMIGCKRIAVKDPC